MQSKTPNCIERPAFVSPGVRPEPQIARGVISVLRDIGPAEFDRADAVQPILAYIKNAAALRPEQPFVPIGGERVDVGGFHVDGESAQSLDRVDKEKAGVTLADLSDSIQIGAISARLLHES